MVQVVPVGEVGRDTVEGLAREFPQVLLVLHPVYGWWQLYELPKGSDWDAARLRSAIVMNHASRGEEARWWDERGAPRIFEQCLMEWPGSWLINFLRERDLWRTDGANGFIKSHEAREKARKLEASKRKHDEHFSLSMDIRRHARDYMDGDPMAGKRKYVITKERDLNG